MDDNQELFSMIRSELEKFEDKFKSQFDQLRDFSHFQKQFDEFDGRMNSIQK